MTNLPNSSIADDYRARLRRKLAYRLAMPSALLLAILCIVPNTVKSYYVGKWIALRPNIWTNYPIMQIKLAAQGFNWVIRNAWLRTVYQDSVVLQYQYKHTVFEKCTYIEEVRDRISSALGTP